MDFDLVYERSYPTPFSNSTLLPLLLISLSQQRIAPRVSSISKEEYDYIIVGAGSAGSVVASRLSEMQSVSVLLLEAGKAPPLLTDVPASYGSFHKTDIDWNFHMVPQVHTTGAQQFPVPRGKVLGGSSILNAMLYVRGNERNYDDWAAHGAEGWSWDGVLPYFLKLEDYRNLEYFGNGLRSIGGPVTVEGSDYQEEVQNRILQAAEFLGYPLVDANGERQTGFWHLDFNLRNGQRCSTAKAYLVPAENRPNLDILSNAFVKKIVLQNNRATGVIYDYKGATYQVKAKREVILSAGAINTPQILMLSGIGPKDHLQKFNIPAIADLPVGKNLHDHLGTSLHYFINNQVPYEKRIRDPNNIHLYIDKRSGPLTSALSIPLTAFLDGSQPNPAVDFPTFQLIFNVQAAESFRRQLGMSYELYQQKFGPYKNSSVYGCFAYNLQPLSRGTITLNSSNPYDPPLIDPNYYSDSRDIDYIIEGVKTCQRIASTGPMKEINISSFVTSYSGCDQYSTNEDRYWKCYAKYFILPLEHAVGTAKMGNTNDPTTVVDPKLRVKGIQGLRVADASIMPFIVSGNTNVPTIMIGEKAADIIKETIAYK